MNTADQGVFDAQRFPPPPPAHLVATANGEGIPNAPGIYFVWKGPSIVYVGLSAHLNQRARLGHPRIREGEMLSFIKLPDTDLVRAESFYIGIIYPKRNCIPGRNPWWLFGEG